MKKYVRSFGVFVALSLAVLALMLTGHAAEPEKEDLSLSNYEARLTDGRENASVTVSEPVTITASNPIKTLYLIYYDTPTDFTLTAGERTVEIKGAFLRQTVFLEQYFSALPESVTITFSSSVKLTEIYGFSGELPSWVQVWEPPLDKADLCLMTTHADDEQLFFAGILPYYAGELNYRVQVIYFTDHYNTPMRRHELLRGLWTVGVNAYPVISPFPDLYSESLSQAQNQMSYRGYSRETLVGFQVEMLRRFRPLVVVGHDPNGEYGHGQHRLNCSTLQEALGLSADPTNYPDSAEKYGTWDTPKAYLHLYEENQIVMNWDEPLAAFDGLTAFQVTQKGFACHDSQQYTWFRRWLNGNNGEITRASQITTYSPCQYGLYRSTVGADVEKNDFFEHLKTWDVQEAEAEAARRKENSTLLLHTLLSRQEEARLDADEAKSDLIARLQEANEKRRMQTILLSVALFVVVSATAFVLWRQLRRYRRLKKRKDR